MYKKVLTGVLAALIAAVPGLTMAGPNGGPDGELGAAAVYPIVPGADWSETETVPPAFFWSGGADPVDEFTFDDGGEEWCVFVTDAFAISDVFGVYDNDVLLGVTSTPSGEDPDPSTGDPTLAFGQPAYSWGVFPVAISGAHSISLTLEAGLSGGRGYIKVDRCPAEDEARIRVSKDFSDDNDAEVTVTLECNDGFVSQDGTAMISEGNHHTFVVTDFADGAMDCSVTESGTDNYTTSPASCDWTDMTAGFYSCNFTNTAKDAMYTVHKVWNVGEGGDVVIEEADVTITCTLFDGTVDVTAGTLGDGDSLTAYVDVEDGDAVCSASEEDLVSSGVETTNDCSQQTLSAGEVYSCTYTNTVFFEGIPTLSQYGLALMALLMLGVGFVGFRRFV